MRQLLLLFAYSSFASTQFYWLNVNINPSSIIAIITKINKTKSNGWKIENFNLSRVCMVGMCVRMCMYVEQRNKNTIKLCSRWLVSLFLSFFHLSSSFWLHLPSSVSTMLICICYSSLPYFPPHSFLSTHTDTHTHTLSSAALCLFAVMFL